LKVTENFDFPRLFADQIVIKEWVINKLPSDNFAVTNAVMLD